STLYDYEVELSVKEKLDGHNLGNIWLSAGQLKELSVNSQLLQTGNIRMDRIEKNHSDNPTIDNDTSVTVVARTNADAATTATNTNPDAAAQTTADLRYQVEFLGLTTGHVTFLGFMKDPSVAWIF